MRAEDAILATLETYADAYCAKDCDRLMAVFDDGDDISLIGTGADELCASRAAVRAVFERNFAEATATRFEWHWKQVTIRDQGAVVAVTLTIHLEVDRQALQIPIRWTVALSNETGTWKWLHRHASAAAGGQEDGSAYPTGK